MEVAPDGSDQRPLSVDHYPDTISWSPNGQVMALGGYGPESADPGQSCVYDLHPVWSPDGTRIGWRPIR